MKNFFCKNSLHLSQTTSQALRKALRKGEIYPARILSRVGENSYRIEILNRQITAASTLCFTPSKIFVQIHALHPRIHLRIISANLQHIDRILELAGSEKIELDSFNQWALAEFINSGYPFSAQRLKKDLARIRRLAQQLPARHLIPLGRYARLLTKSPELFAELPFMLFPEPVPILNWEKNFAAAIRPEDILRTLHYCYIRYSLENDRLEQTLRKDGITADLTRIKKTGQNIQAFNTFMHPDYSLSGFLVPGEHEIQTVLIEGKQDKSGTDIIQRYEFPYTLADYGCFRVNLRFLENMLSISCFYDNPRLKSKLAEFEPSARALAATYRLKILPFHYEMSCHRTIL